MLSLKFIAILSIILVKHTQRSSGDGILSMRLFHFENPQSRLPDGSCCDGSKGSTGLCNPCGYYFKICLANMGSKDCTLFNITTQVLTNYEYYLFQSSFYTHPASKNIKNPIKIALDGWKGIFSLAIDVYDEDGYINPKTDDLVSSMQQNVTIAATRFGAEDNVSPIVLVGEQRFSEIFPKLTLQLSVKCKKNYLIPNCSDYCIDTNDASGHYKCNYIKGSRDCYHGWYGSRCDTHCIPRNDTLGHFTCDERTGLKTCLPGWLGVATNCTQENTTRIHLASTPGSIFSQPTLSTYVAIPPTDKYQKTSDVTLSYSIVETRIIQETVKNDANTTKATNSTHLRTTIEHSQHVIKPTSTLRPLTGSFSSNLAATKTSYNGDGPFKSAISNSSSLRTSFKGVRFTKISDTVLVLASSLRSFNLNGVITSPKINATIHPATIHPTFWTRVAESSYQTPLNLSSISPHTILLRPTVEKAATERVASFYSVMSRNSNGTIQCSTAFAYTTLHQKETLRKTVTSLRSFTVLSTSSIVLKQNQTEQEKIGALSRFWKNNQEYLLTAIGVFALIAILVFTAVRIKRKNRVQRLRGSETMSKSNQRLISASVERIDGPNPYILLQQANLHTANHRSCCSVRSNELSASNKGNGISRSFIDSKMSSDTMIENCVTPENLQPRVECWTPIKCWTPIDIQAQKMGDLAACKMGSDCCTISDGLAPRDCRTQRDFCTPSVFHRQTDSFTPSSASLQSSQCSVQERDHIAGQMRDKTTSLWMQKGCQSPQDDRIGKHCNISEKRKSGREIRTSVGFEASFDRPVSCRQTPPYFATVELNGTTFYSSTELNVPLTSDDDCRTMLNTITPVSHARRNIEDNTSRNYLLPPANSSMETQRTPSTLHSSSTLKSPI